MDKFIILNKKDPIATDISRILTDIKYPFVWAETNEINEEMLEHTKKGIDVVISGGFYLPKRIKDSFNHHLIIIPCYSPRKSIRNLYESHGAFVAPQSDVHSSLYVWLNYLLKCGIISNSQSNNLMQRDKLWVKALTNPVDLDTEEFNDVEKVLIRMSGIPEDDEDIQLKEGLAVERLLDKVAEGNVNKRFSSLTLPNKDYSNFGGETILYAVSYSDIAMQRVLYKALDNPEIPYPLVSFCVKENFVLAKSNTAGLVEDLLLRMGINDYAKSYQQYSFVVPGLHEDKLAWSIRDSLLN